MKTLFLSFDLWDVIEYGVPTASESSSSGGSVSSQVKLEKQKDAKALFTLQQAVSESIFPRLMRATTSKQAWEISQLEFQRNSKLRLLSFKG